MCPYQKIGQRHNFSPTGAAVPQKDLAGEKRGFTRNGSMVKAPERECSFQLLDAIEPYGYLGIYDWIDHKRPLVSSLLKSCTRPREPRWVLREDIE